MKVKIGEKIVGDNYPVFIIAEAGINHNGSIKIAKKMIEKASQINVDAIKFQTFKAEDLAIPSSVYFKIFKKLELEFSDFGELADYSKSQGVMFCSTPFSENAVDMLTKLKTPVFKIASGDLTHIPLISYAASKKKAIILSTGMGNFNEIKMAVNAIRKQNNKKIVIMHSVSSYPTPPEEANLRVIESLKKKLCYPIGYSDNGLDLLVPLTAIAMGAKIIEKHFTLDRNMKGPDHSFSADPNQMKSLIEQGKKIEEILGDGIKLCQPSELENRINARRSIKTACQIMKGTRITKEMLSITRPAIGIHPKDLKKVLGKIAKRNIKINESVQWKYLK